MHNVPLFLTLTGGLSPLRCSATSHNGSGFAKTAPEQIDHERDRTRTELFGKSPDIDVSSGNAKHDAGTARS